MGSVTKVPAKSVTQTSALGRRRCLCQPSRDRWIPRKGEAGLNCDPVRLCYWKPSFANWGSGNWSVQTEIGLRDRLQRWRRRWDRCRCPSNRQLGEYFGATLPVNPPAAEPGSIESTGPITGDEPPPPHPDNTAGSAARMRPPRDTAMNRID